MKVNPKVKIAGGISLIGVSAYEFFNVSKTKGKTRWIHLAAGLGLLAGGIYLTRNGYVLLNQPKPKETGKSDNSDKTGKTSGKGNTETIKTPNNQQSQTESVSQNKGNEQLVAQKQKVDASQQKERLSAEGSLNGKQKLDPRQLEISKQKRQKIEQRISELNGLIKKCPRTYEGSKTKMNLNNELGLLKLQL